MVNTIKNVKMIITAMYSTQSPPPLIRESKQPPPFPYQVIIAKYFNIFNITNYFIIKSHHINLAHFHCCEGGIMGFGGYAGTASRINADFSVREKCL